MFFIYYLFIFIDLDDKNRAVSLINVNHEILLKIIEYCNYYRKDAVPMSDENPKNTEICEECFGTKKEEPTQEMLSWEAEFCKVDDQTLCDLMKVCTFFWYL